MKTIRALQRLPLWMIARFFLGASILVFPFQIRTVFSTPHQYTSGLFEWYSVQFIYVFDILILISLLFLLLDHLIYQRVFSFSWTWPKLLIPFVLFCSFLKLISSPSVFLFADFISWFFIFIFFFLLQQTLFSFHELMLLFSAGIGVQGGIALLQFFFQQSIGIGFLGEPIVSNHLPGVAKLRLGGWSILRPYGTFSHPNVFAAAVLMALTYFFVFRSYFERYLHILFLFLIIIFLLLFSKTLLIGFAFSLVFYKLFYTKVVHGISTHKIFWVLLGGILLCTQVGYLIPRSFVENNFDLILGESYSLRAEYFQTSFGILFSFPLGIVPENYAQILGMLAGTRLAPWEIQPVHHFFLQFGVFYGVLPFLFIIFLFLCTCFSLLKEFYASLFHDHRKKQGLFLLMITISFIFAFLNDHYFFTLHEGRVLMAFWFALVTVYVKMPRLPLRKS